MTDFLSKYRQNIKHNPKNRFAEDILMELAEQLRIELKAKELYAYVSRSDHFTEGALMVNLTIMSNDQRVPYFYRLIEIEQPMDNAYPVKMSAFQNPPTDWENIETPEALSEALTNIMGNPRVLVVFDLVSQMTKSAKEWLDIKETEENKK